MTSKQKLQRDRAYFKFVIAGLYKPIKEESLTPNEQVLWQSILLRRTSLLQDHDNNSRALGLKVPEFRCWCGKEGKYNPEYDLSYTDCTKVCKKHIRNE